jgi:hypothetical protein
MKIEKMTTEYLEFLIAESGKQFFKERKPITQDECPKNSIYWLIFEELKKRKNNVK